MDGCLVASLKGIVLGVIVASVVLVLSTSVGIEITGARAVGSKVVLTNSSFDDTPSSGTMIQGLGVGKMWFSHASADGTLDVLPPDDTYVIISCYPNAVERRYGYETLGDWEGRSLTSFVGPLIIFSEGY